MYRTPTDFFKCLADDTRLKSMLLITLEGELCVCELMEALDEIQPKISRHLSQLRQQSLLQDRRHGQWVFYQLHPKLKDWQREILYETAKHEAAYLRSARKRLHNMQGRPDRKSQCS